MQAAHRQFFALNVLGTPLESCCADPATGYFRDGYCRIAEEDRGTHVMCAVMTNDFLQFSRSRGNDLITPHPEMSFPGLREGDRWCLCALRWVEAAQAGVAPPVVLAATHSRALEYISLAALLAHQLIETPGAGAGLEA